MKSLMGSWRGLVVPVLLILAAEIAARVSHLQSDSLAAPSQIVRAGARCVERRQFAARDRRDARLRRARPRDRLRNRFGARHFPRSLKTARPLA